MNINKYLIAAMITVGIMNGVDAQNNNNKNSVISKQSNKRSSPDAWAINSAKQTQAMKRELALNESQLKEVKKINDSHAKEIEVAMVECGDDVTGFNSYLDRVSHARDRELKSVLTPEQFASYTSKKDDKNWLGIQNFKYKSEDGELKVKNNDDELKIKGKNNMAGVDLSAQNKGVSKPDMSSDAFSNNNNIVIDSVSVSEGISIDSGASGSTYPGGGETGTSTRKFEETVKSEYNNRSIERVKPEYDNMYRDPASTSTKEYKEVSKKATKTGSNHKKKPLTSKSKTSSKAGEATTKSNSTTKAPVKSNSNIAASKSTTKKKTTAKSGTVKKQKKAPGSAAVTKKNKVDTMETKSSKVIPVMPDTTASSIPLDTTVKLDEFFLIPDTTARVIVIPDTIGVTDTTSSASAKSPNYFIDKDSKAKFTGKESKIKPTDQNKIKETDSEFKSKEGDNKVKDEKNESKVKRENLKIKINK